MTHIIIGKIVRFLMILQLKKIINSVLAKILDDMAVAGEGETEGAPIRKRERREGEPCGLRCTRIWQGWD